MRLVTERLAIAPLGEADIDAFVAYRTHPEVARYQSWETSYGHEDALDLVRSQATLELPARGGWLQLGVHTGGHPDHDTLVGDVAVHLLDEQPNTWEIGVTFAPRDQGRGFATEAVSAVVAALFNQHGAHRVVAFCDARNIAVHRLFERVGLRRESRQVDADWFKGEWTTLDGYAVLAREWNGDVRALEDQPA
jgi:RimJ/RimL family protein N-acetyltransferase